LEVRKIEGDKWNNKAKREERKAKRERRKIEEDVQKAETAERENTEGKKGRPRIT
jgi:hypothetical protein